MSQERLDIERLELATANRSLLELLQLAATKKMSIRLMRIGTPREFRMAVIDAVDNSGVQLNHTCRLLLHPDIKKVFNCCSPTLLGKLFSEGWIPKNAPTGRRCA